MNNEQNKNMSNIDPKVMARLVRAVQSLNNAGRDQHGITVTLGAKESFGKYAGCTLTNIQEIVAETVVQKWIDDNMNLKKARPVNLGSMSDQARAHGQQCGHDVKFNKAKTAIN
jgi:hypothetical protein